MTPSTSDSITVNNLEKRFGAFVAVNKITFSVRKGEIFGFLGANGSGKSTTIRMLCGIITPTSGSGFVAGHDIMTDAEEVKHSIGYMSQKFSLYDELTVNENLLFSGSHSRLSNLMAIAVHNPYFIGLVINNDILNESAAARQEAIHFEGLLLQQVDLVFA